MERKLKKIKNENYRFYYFNFREADGSLLLDKNTRLISFILDEQFEIATDHWYELYVKIFNYLQRTRPHSLMDILEAPSLVTSRVDLFVAYDQGNYIQTECGLYIKRFTNINKIIMVIKRILQMYYINLSDAYLVVEVPPKYEGEEAVEIIKQEKEILRKHLCSIYVEGESYYKKAILVIDELNKLIQTWSPTSYNNLYLLNSLKDYRCYSHSILNNYICFNRGTYTKREYHLVVEWLECARFFDGDIFRTNPLEVGDSYIEENGKSILVTTKTRIISEEVTNNE